MSAKPLDAADLDTEAVAEALYSLLSNLLRHQPREISMTATSTLSTLRHSGPRRITALAAAQKVTQPSMTVLIGTLERDGLVSRRPDPDDGRAALIELTEQGHEFIARRRADYARGVGEYLAKLPPERQAEIAAAVPALRLLDDVIGHG
ncbi:putative MarR family transcriptional regulator [Gordonia effusa NBRC 100432]|uniref:Putative MarR family transcriptional regulator n=1 Tax=Gordonia effusa NBRC 100432 TaxID=1077974 RepID=H0QYJ6_9ACTN|nr:MarR family transcriptional regulator [Gordonia effusa]GAB17897.1 putative MarR family transcriptional regulator [Gordonia effusa NBRC 100432]